MAPPSVAPPTPLGATVGRLSVIAVVVLILTVAVRQRHPPPPPSVAPDCPRGTVLVPKGRFIVADRHDTGWVEPFCLDVTEVTVEAYAACVASTACSEPDAFKADDLENRAACNWRREGAALHPVNCVSAPQATAYCAWAGGRLPTEEEWEWAARGGHEVRTFPWGDDEPKLGRLNACGAECVAWARTHAPKPWTAMYEGDDGWPTTAPVGSFPAGATPLGIQDMAGNVREWTSSAFDTTSRVTRGGGWSDFKVDRVRVGYRSGEVPNARGRNLGFRCAL